LIADLEEPDVNEKTVFPPEPGLSGLFSLFENNKVSNLEFHVSLTY